MALGVLFDIDGTLVSFNFDVQGSRKALLAELAREGFDASVLSLTSPTQYFIDSVRDQVTSGKVSADFQAVRKKLYSILDEFELQTSGLVSVFPGTAETLAFLQAKSVKLAVVTNSGRRAATEVLSRASLLEFFDFVLTRDDVDAMKPNPGGVNQAVSMLSMPKDHIFYVGDSLYDVMAARTAGLKVISVATGNYTAERLKAEGAEIVLKSLSELPSVLPL